MEENKDYATKYFVPFMFVSELDGKVQIGNADEIILGNRRISTEEDILELKKVLKNKVDGNLKKSNNQKNVEVKQITILNIIPLEEGK